MKKELYEIEQDARRMRAEELSRLMQLGAEKVASLFRAFAVKEIRHA